MEEFFTVDEIASMTRLSTRTIRRYISDGTLKGIKAGRQWRFTATNIEDFFDQSELIEETTSQQKKRLIQFFDGTDLEHIQQPTGQTIIMFPFEAEETLALFQQKTLDYFNQSAGKLEHLAIYRMNPFTLRVIISGPVEAMHLFSTEINQLYTRIIKKTVDRE